MTKNVVRLIFQDGFWDVLIPFVLMVQFKFLAQFSVDHFVHPVVSTLFALFFCLHLWCDCSFRLNHYIIYIYYFVASCLFLFWPSPYCIVFAVIRRDSVSLLRFPFLSNVQFFWCDIFFVAWNIHTVVFLPISFCFLFIFVLVLSAVFLVHLISLRLYCIFLLLFLKHILSALFLIL